MPVGPLAIAGIAAGAQLAGQGINAMSLGKTNKKTREWNEKMYGMQRTDALADWQRQNEYNSPVQQMARLKEAGLNPNLVYSNGATSDAGPVRSTDVKGWNPEPQKIDLAPVGSELARYYDMKLKEAQTNNVNQLTQNAKVENDLKVLEKTMKGQTIARNDIDLKYLNDIKLNSLEALKANIKNTEARTTATLDSNQRSALTTAQNLQIGLKRLSLMSTTNEVMKKNIELLQDRHLMNQFEIGLNKLGMTRTDEIYFRFLYKALNSSDLKQTINDMNKEWDKNHPNIQRDEMNPTGGYMYKGQFHKY